MGKTTDQPDDLPPQFEGDTGAYLQPMQQFTFKKDEMEWGKRMGNSPTLEILTQAQKGYILKGSILKGSIPRRTTYLAKYIRVKRNVAK